MAKATPGTGNSVLRGLPSVEKILTSAAVAPLVAEFGRARVKSAVAAHLQTLRHDRSPWDERDATAAIRALAGESTMSSLRPVINGSGVIIHTNLGRSPIAPQMWERAADAVTGYSNLEFDLDAGERGARDEHLGALCATLFGCEAAVLANNNAAAVLLLLSAVARGREVIVSRGELVEIGGSFRVPDVIQQGGARLREVGTTNRTRARDYAEACSAATAAILRVHRSNFEIVGFTETPGFGELIDVAHEKKVPLLYDEGSGRVVDLVKYGFAPAATIRELIAAGVDAVTCSTDKLIGATQGGLILGSEEIVGKCRKHPLMRALRAGKESYAVIAETLRAFATERYEEEIAIYRMLAAPLDALRARAEELVRGTSCRVVDSDCALGGGTTPAETIPSLAVAAPGDAAEAASRFLAGDPPVVGRIVDGVFLIDVRTLLERDLRALRDQCASYYGI
jgi:L-seryl-tRNA(Ser) seleniumtransferase